MKSVVTDQYVDRQNPFIYFHSGTDGYEDLLGITRGGSDGRGHLGMAGAVGLKPFGSDVFKGWPPSRRR